MGYLFPQLGSACLLGWLLLTGCSSDKPPGCSTSSELAIASSDYVVLAQKALAYQADFNTEAWALMLADSIEYRPPDKRPSCRGKGAVVLDWQQRQARIGVQTMRLSGFTSLPLVASQPLSISGRSGVHIVTYCTAQVEYANGQISQFPLNVCHHFDAAKRIDYCRIFSPNLFLNSQ